MPSAASLTLACGAAGSHTSRVCHLVRLTRVREKRLELFKALDTSRDWLLAERELGAGLETLGFRLPPHVLSLLIDEIRPLREEETYTLSGGITDFARSRRDGAPTRDSFTYAIDLDDDAGARVAAVSFRWHFWRGDGAGA